MPTLPNCVDLDFNLTAEAGRLLYIGSPRQYRADCKSGQFKIGAGQMVGRTLKMEVIAARFIEDELFGYPYQKWVNLIFADPSGVVSSVLLKTESMDNFLEVYRLSIERGTPLPSLSIQGRMSQRAGESGPYFAVEFEIVGPGQFGPAIQEFTAEMPHGLFLLEQRIPGENGRESTGLSREERVTILRGERENGIE